MMAVPLVRETLLGLVGRSPDKADAVHGFPPVSVTACEHCRRPTDRGSVKGGEASEKRRPEAEGGFRPARSASGVEYRPEPTQSERPFEPGAKRFGRASCEQRVRLRAGASQRSLARRGGGCKVGSQAVTGEAGGPLMAESRVATDATGGCWVQAAASSVVASSRTRMAAAQRWTRSATCSTALVSRPPQPAM